MEILCYAACDYEKAYFEAANHHRMHIRYVSPSLSEETVHLASGHDAVCIFVNDVCNRQVLQALHSYGVRCVLLRCAGYNNVDSVAAQEIGIPVARVPKYSPHAVAEHTLGLLLCLNRKIHRAYNRIREGNFLLGGLVGTTLAGKKVGVIGYGYIGKVFANIMTGLSCDVMVYDPYVADLGASHTQVELSALLKHSDIISLHCPLSPETYHLICEETLALIEKKAILLNTSRGALIDTGAIIKALKQKRIGALAIDVYEEEEGLFFQDHSAEMITDDTFERLLTFPNVLVTGHQAFLTQEALADIAKTTLENAHNLLRGRDCPNLV